MYILGFSAFYHDSAACLINNGKIVVAAQEERFSRKKNDATFPFESIRFCLRHEGISLSNVDYIIFYDKPLLKFERIIQTTLEYIPLGFSLFKKFMPVWLKDKLFQKKIILNSFKEIKNVNVDNKLFFSDHHLSHASSAYFPSPFDEAIILTLDGVGEWTTSSIYIGKDNDIKKIKEITFPHSLGLLYSSFTYFCGFKVNSGEYKLMGLAPYGNPKYKNIIYEHLIDVLDDGSFNLNMNYFGYCYKDRMINDKFIKLFGISPRKPEDEVTTIYMDIAASIQAVLEEIIEKIIINTTKLTGIKNIAIAGGVGLNCVVNGKIVEKKIVDNIWIQPASGDSGGAIGAALAFYYLGLKEKRNHKNAMHDTYLGPSYSNKYISKALKSTEFNVERLDDSKLIKKVAILLANKKSIGWFSGRMEFGPRSLGNRSILADPRDKKMQKDLNLKIKFRESFRPFAPSVIESKSRDWFEINIKSPFMLLVSKVKSNKIIKYDNKAIGFKLLNLPKSTIPSVTHVDLTARLHTVSKKTNKRFYNLLTEFERITGVPILINTSFNIRGEPIVCSPEDAIKCFSGTNLDYLVIENFIVSKKKNFKINNYLSNFELD
jgi:carbamoyltransferase